MNTDTNCRFCAGSGEIFETLHNSGVIPIHCVFCHGSGRKYDTLTPFLNQLDDLKLVIDTQARFMEDVANIGLQEMVERFNREAVLKYPITARERLESAWQRHFKDHAFHLDSGYRTHEEHLRLHEKWLSEPGQVMAVNPGQSIHHRGVAFDTGDWVPAERFEHDFQRDMLRLREPWHYEYTALPRKSLPRRLADRIYIRTGWQWAWRLGVRR